MKEMQIPEAKKPKRDCSHVSVARTFIMASWQEVSTEAHRRVSRQGAGGKKTFVIFLITILFCSLQAVESGSHLNVNGSGGWGSAVGDHLLG